MDGHLCAVEAGEQANEPMKQEGSMLELLGEGNA